MGTTILRRFLGISLLLDMCLSFAPCSLRETRSIVSTRTALASSPLDDDVNSGTVLRRTFGYKMAGLIGGSAAFVLGEPAFAKGSPDYEADKQKIYTGYQRLNYLIDNWVKETTVCGMSDNPYISVDGCERTPVKVMEYMGYKNINDPLFKAEKTLRRLEDLVPAGQESDYVDAVERWTEKADEANGMAFVSSWGEANPGGGKDRVELFIERAKNDVIGARDSLKTVVTILDLTPA